MREAGRYEEAAKSSALCLPRRFEAADFRHGWRGPRHSMSIVSNPVQERLALSVTSCKHTLLNDQCRF